MYNQAEYWQIFHTIGGGKFSRRRAGQFQQRRRRLRFVGGGGAPTHNTGGGGVQILPAAAARRDRRRGLVLMKTNCIFELILFNILKHNVKELNLMLFISCSSSVQI